MIYKFTAPHVIVRNLLRVAGWQEIDPTRQHRVDEMEMRVLSPGLGTARGCQRAHMLLRRSMLFTLMRSLPWRRHRNARMGWADGSRRSAAAGMKIASRAQTFRAAGSGR